MLCGRELDSTDLWHVWLADRSGRSWVWIPSGPSDFFFLRGIQTSSWASGFFTEVKRPGREVDQLPQSTVDGKNEWSITSTPAMYLRGVGREDYILPSSGGLFRTRIWTCGFHERPRICWLAERLSASREGLLVRPNPPIQSVFV